MKILRRFTSAFALLVLLGGAQHASAQSTINWEGPSPGVLDGNWNVGGNWDNNFGPGTAFQEIANISNGGIVTVDSDIASSTSGQPARIVLGQNLGETGSLVIANNGVLEAVFTEHENQPDPDIIVGGDGVGHLTINSNGSLAARGMIVGGDLSVSGSTATFGSTASVTIAQTTTASRQIRIIGPSVSYSTTDLNLFGSSTFVPEITAASHSTVDVSGALAISAGATLRPEFNGFAPTAGNSWNLFDATTITGDFTLDTSQAPALPFGQQYTFSTVENGSNGFYGQLGVDQKLVLNVNRADGSVSIATGSLAISIDGYSIQSELGALTPGTWNSLEDQALSDWRESPQGGSVNALSELKPSSSTEVTNAMPLSLGNAFQLPAATEFGTELEDLTFEYYSAADGVQQGIINYIGNKQNNNLVLLVDPATGESRMENQSTLAVSIEGYVIESADGSLQPADGSWDSLDDQEAAGGDWRESNPSDSLLAELKPSSSTEFSSGTGYNLGELFDTAGEQDLTFQYLLAGEDEFSNGVVEYRSFDSFAPADFDEDGDVDAADLADWQSAYGAGSGADADNDGDSDGADFLAWQRQHTGPAVSGVSVVPEPSSLVLLLGIVCPLALRRAGGILA